MCENLLQTQEKEVISTVGHGHDVFALHFEGEAETSVMMALEHITRSFGHLERLQSQVALCQFSVDIMMSRSSGRKGALKADLPPFEGCASCGNILKRP